MSVTKETLDDAKDSRECSKNVMLDYSQAFDSISHELLLEKMKYYQFGDTSIDLIKSYLDNRL